MFLLWIALGHAETLYAATAAEGVRWPDVAVVTVDVAPGDPVEVLARDGDRVRVRKGTAFGWVPAAALVSTPPATPPSDAPPPAELSPPR